MQRATSLRTRAHAMCRARRVLERVRLGAHVLSRSEHHAREPRMPARRMVWARSPASVPPSHQPAELPFEAMELRSERVHLIEHPTSGEYVLEVDFPASNGCRHREPQPFASAMGRAESRRTHATAAIGDGAHLTHEQSSGSTEVPQERPAAWGSSWSHFEQFTPSRAGGVATARTTGPSTSLPGGEPPRRHLRGSLSAGRGAQPSMQPPAGVSLPGARCEPQWRHFV